MNKLQYCIKQIQEHATPGDTIIAFYPCIYVPSFGNMPPLFCIHKAEAANGKLYVFDYNGERHEIENRPEDAPALNSLYEALKEEAKVLDKTYQKVGAVILSIVIVFFIVLFLFSCKKEAPQNDCITFITSVPDSIANRNIIKK